MTNQERIDDLNNSIKYWTDKLSTTINNVDRGDLSERIRLAREEITRLSVNNDKSTIISHSDAAPIADRLEKGIDTRSSSRGRGYVVGNPNVFRFDL